VDRYGQANPANARAWNNLGYALAAEGDAASARAQPTSARLRSIRASPRPRANLDALRR
jgi:Flp pilus assembly protein TadD